MSSFPSLSLIPSSILLRCLELSNIEKDLDIDTTVLSKDQVYHWSEPMENVVVCVCELIDWNMQTCRSVFDEPQGLFDLLWYTMVEDPKMV